MRLQPHDLGFREITEADISVFFNEVSDMHDAVLRGFFITCHSFVDARSAMNMDFKRNGILHIQSQIVQDFEILAEGIRSVKLDSLYEIEYAVLKMEGEVFCMEIRDEFRLVAEKFYFRFIDPQTNAPYLGKAIPESDMFCAWHVGKGWKVCENCGDSWQRESKIDICPGCNRTVILKE